MVVEDLAKELGYTALQSECEGGEIADAYTSDLLSDVMGNAPDDSVLITIQAHKNTIAVATLAGVKAVVLCSKRTPEDDMLDAAKQEGIAVYQSNENQFRVSCAVGKLLSK